MNYVRRGKMGCWMSSRDMSSYYECLQPVLPRCIGRNMPSGRHSYTKLRWRCSSVADEVMKLRGVVVQIRPDGYYYILLRTWQRHHISTEWQQLKVSGCESCPTTFSQGCKQASAPLVGEAARLGFSDSHADTLFIFRWWCRMPFGWRRRRLRWRHLYVFHI